MGKRGPKRTPTAVLKARGSWLAARRTDDEPQPGRGIPTMPHGLDHAAKRIWKRVTAELDRMGVLTTNDGDSLARYCINLARWRRAVRVLQTKGETFDHPTDNGGVTVKPRPEVGIAKGLAVELAKLEAAFGMTPSDRAGLSVTGIYNNTKAAPAPAPDGAPAPIDGKDRFFR